MTLDELPEQFDAFVERARAALSQEITTAKKYHRGGERRKKCSTERGLQSRSSMQVGAEPARRNQ